MKALFFSAVILAFATSSSGAEVLVLEKGAEIPLARVKKYFYHAVAANMLEVNRDDLIQAESITFPNGETLKR